METSACMRSRVAKRKELRDRRERNRYKRKGKGEREKKKKEKEKEMERKSTIVRHSNPQPAHSAPKNIKPNLFLTSRRDIGSSVVPKFLVFQSYILTHPLSHHYPFQHFTLPGALLSLNPTYHLLHACSSSMLESKMNFKQAHLEGKASLTRTSFRPSLHPFFSLSHSH